MLISKNKRSFVVLLLFIAGLFIPNLIVCQCNLFISDEINPSTCGTSDGSFSVSSYGTCEKTISVYKGNTKLITRQNSLTIIDLPSGVYKVVAERGCGCSTAITRYVSLTSSEETVLIPYVNIGSGKYESDNVEVCSGSSVDLGVQTLGISGLRISGPNGYVDVTPDGSGFWRFTNLKFSQSGIYTINYTNPKGCTSSVNIRLTVKNLTVNIGNDREACVGTNQTLTANVTGSSICKENCTANVDSLLVRWSLDQCNANGLNNQLDYTEFLPEYPSLGNCTNIYATNIYKQKGDHSCTPVLGSYDGDIGMCIMAQESCNPANYEPDKAIKFEVTLTPAEAGRITGMSFREQSPLVWITTNGATGPNNYNTKYLLRVYKNNILIHSVDGKDTERSWNLEEFDFSSDPKFAISETTTFRFELRGYCVTENGGNMAGWELDDIRVFGGCCTGLTSNSSLGYLWSTGETTSSINVNPNETSLYSVTVQDCSGCSKSDTLKVTVFPLPVPSIAGDTTICKGGTTVLTANGGGTYLWSTGATSASLSVNPALTQIYTVTVTSINNCTAVSSVKVLVKDLPSPVITGVSEICAGDSTTLTASGALSYQWNTGQTSASITVKPKISTEYRVMAVDQNGCMEYTSVFITVNQLPIPKISGDTIICAGKSTTLTASGGAMYNWNTGSTTVSISISPSSNQNYSVTVVDGKGCSASTFVKVTVNPLPIVTISGNSSFCTGVSSTLTASGGGTYLWSTGATTTSITINPSLTTTYTVTVTNEQGCTATASRMASVMGLPKAKIEGEVKICSGDAITLTASGGVAYRWSTGQTTSVINVSPSIATMYKVTVTDANGCTDTSVHGVNVNSKPEVTISGNDKFCTGNSTVLTANVTGKTFCEKDCKDEQLLRWTLDQCNAEGLTNQLSYSEFTANISSKGGLASVSGSNVARNRGDHSCTFDGTGGVGMCFGVLADCDPNQYNPINALRFSVTLRPAEVGNLSKLTFREQSPLNWQTTNGATGINNYNQKYLIRVYKNGALVYSQNEMNTERIWNLESFDFSTHPEFRITTETEFTFELYGYCVVERGGTAGWEIDDIKIFGGECPSSPSVDNITYLWSTGETTKSISVAPSTTSSYSVTVSDCNNCKGSDDILVTVYPLPVLRIDGDNIICVGESTTLVASGGTSFIWNNGATNASISVNPIVTSNYTVTITDVNGCSASKTLEVTVNSLPVVNITGNNVICIGGSTTLTAGGGVSYTWSNGANTTSVTVSPTVNTIYTVTATDINGCKANTSISVKVNPLPIPSISGDNIICVGESTTLVATGGVTYMWNNASTGNSISVSEYLQVFKRSNRFAFSVFCHLSSVL